MMDKIAEHIAKFNAPEGSMTRDVNGKTSKQYSVWNAMMRRCYSESQQRKQPTYIGCSVSEEWHDFPTFKKWYDKNHIDGFDMDKDILLPGNKIYSKETCRFIPKILNRMFATGKQSGKKLPLGISISCNNGLYRARTLINSKSKELGTFKSLNDAQDAYFKAKLKNNILITTKYYENNDIDSDIYFSLIEKIKSIYYKNTNKKENK